MPKTPEQPHYQKLTSDDRASSLDMEEQVIPSSLTEEEHKELIDLAQQINQAKREGRHKEGIALVNQFNQRKEEIFQQKEETEEETTETEQREGEPTLIEQATTYAEIWKEKGVTKETILKVARELQAEMSEEEKKDLTMLIYLPEQTTTADAWQMVKDSTPTREAYDPSTDEGKITTEGERDEKAIVAFGRYQQEPDEDSLGDKAKPAEDWEEETKETDQKYMSPKLRMVANELYRLSEGKQPDGKFKQLDEKNFTLCPGSRTADGKVPNLSFNPDHGEVYLSSFHPGYQYPSLGVRRVVSKEI
jgi:uncharacterized protein YerC